MNRCSDYSIMGCPASLYLSCSAYKEGKNCWETERDIPCCQKDKAECGNCRIYIKGRGPKEEVTV